jgi:exodeoxyribonuclease VII large subunit
VHGHKTLQSRLATLSARLSLLSPQNVLNRGYSITLDAATGTVIRAANQVSAGQRLRTQLSSGELQSVATAQTSASTSPSPDSGQAPLQPASES